MAPNVQGVERTVFCDLRSDPGPRGRTTANYLEGASTANLTRLAFHPTLLSVFRPNLTSLFLGALGAPPPRHCPNQCLTTSTRANVGVGLCAFAAGMHRTLFPSSCTSTGTSAYSIGASRDARGGGRRCWSIGAVPWPSTPAPTEGPPRSKSPNLNRQPHSEVPAYRQRAPVRRVVAQDILVALQRSSLPGLRPQLCKGGRGRLLISGL